MIPKPPFNIVVGQAGVHRVAAELLVRHLVPYVPSVDAGVDLIVEGHLRVQVKTTMRPTNHWRSPGAFSFSLAHCQRIKKRKYVPGAKRRFSTQCDFVILHAFESNRFWIVPASILDDRWTVLFKDGRKQWRDVDVARARELRSTGMSYRAIAMELGGEPVTIKRRLNGSRPEPKRRYADISQYENRWDLITAALTVSAEADRVMHAGLDTTSRSGVQEPAASTDQVRTDV